jgi:hypothetical protein
MSVDLNLFSIINNGTLFPHSYSQRRLEIVQDQEKDEDQRSGGRVISVVLRSHQTLRIPQMKPSSSVTLE